MLSCGFKVWQLENVRRSDFHKLIQVLSEDVDFHLYSSLVVATSSHGFQGHITLRDNLPVNLQTDVIDVLGRSEGWTGKPVSLWVQACQHSIAANLRPDDVSVAVDDVTRSPDFQPPGSIELHVHVFMLEE